MLPLPLSGDQHNADHSNVRSPSLLRPRAASLQHQGGVRCAATSIEGGGGTSAGAALNSANCTVISKTLPAYASGCGRKLLPAEHACPAS